MIWIIIVLGFLLRLISLNQSFWLDEATSANVVKNFNFTEIITKFSPGDFHPPLYYLSLKAWTGIFGVTEISTRFFSILAALGTIYLVFLVGKKLMSRNLGLVSAILLATAPLHIYYSQEARMYSLETFLVTLLVYFFILIVKEGKTRQWLAFAITLVLVGATDYLPLLLIPVFWLYAGATNQKVSWWTRFLASHIPLALAFLVWAPIFSSQLAAGLAVRESASAWWGILGKSGFKEALLLPIKFMIGRIGFTSRFLYAVLVGIPGVIFTYLFIKSIKKSKKNLILYLWLLVPVVLAFVLGLKLSVFSYFRLLFVLPALYLILGIGLLEVKEALFAPLFFLAVVLNIIFSGIYLANTKFQREDWRGLTGFLQAESKDKKAVTLFPANSQMEAFNYYAPDAKIAGPQGAKKGYDTIWLMRYIQPVFDPKDTLRLKLESLGYKKTSEHDFNGVVVWKYEK